MTNSTPPWCRRSTSITEQRGLLPQARRKIEFVVGFFALAKIKDQQGIKPCLLRKLVTIVLSVLVVFIIIVCVCVVERDLYFPCSLPTHGVCVKSRK